MATRFDRGFRFPLQKYSEEKALYTNFRYLQEYLNYIRKKDLYGVTVVIASSTSDNPERAHFRADGQNDDEQLQAAVDSLSSTGGTVVLLEGTYNIASQVTLPNSHVKLVGQGAKIDTDGTWLFGGGGQYHINGFEIIGGAAGIGIIRGSGKFIVTDNYFHDLKANYVMGAKSLVDISTWIVIGNFFEDIDLELGGVNLDISAVLISDEGGSRSAEGVFMGNYVEDITKTDDIGNSHYVVYSEGDRGFSVVGNFVADISTLDGFVADAAFASHNVIDGVMVDGTHDIDLDELGDVVISSVADNEVLAFDNSSGNWINQTAAEAGLAAAVHSHVGSDITDFAEVAQDAVGGILADSSEIDFTYADATPSITAALVAGSIDETKLDASVNASLDLADSAMQPGDDAADLGSDSATDGYVLTADGVGGAAWEEAPGAGSGISEVVEDTSPQLGGDLDAQAFDITGVTELAVEEVSVQNNTDAVEAGTFYASQTTGEERMTIAGGSGGLDDPYILLYGAADSGGAGSIFMRAAPGFNIAVDRTGTPRDVYFYGGTIYYTSSGTFDKADYPGLRAIEVECQAGGGAGGGAPSTAGGQISVGAPGGGGCYARSFILVSDLDTTEAVTVGAGGTGASGTTGGDGNSSSFDTISGEVSATGGGGGGVIAAGNTDAAVVGGNGGQSGVGDIVIGGHSAPATYRLLASAAVSNSGGNSFLGSGGTRVSSNTAGNPGVQGGGGSGTVNGASQSARTGAAGGDGVVIVHLHY